MDMIVTACVMLIAGFYVTWWGHRAERALYKIGTVLVASSLGWLLIVAASVLFSIEASILLGIVSFCGSLLYLSYIYGDERRAIKKILNCYFSAKKVMVQDSESQILKETGTRYYRGLGWSESRIKKLIDEILDENKESPTNDIVAFTVWLLQFQLPTLKDRWGPRCEMVTKSLSRSK